ncbi:MAG: GH116 family glycosyl hydrolase [Planctomycetota bacterium]
MFISFVASLFLAAPAPQSSNDIIDLGGVWRFAPDPKNEGTSRGFEKPDFNDNDWKEIEVNRGWELQGFDGIDGYAWYRKQFELKRLPAGAAILELGVIDDIDEVFINNVRAGGTGKFPPEAETAWTKNRYYPIPANLLKEGINQIAVRVFDENGDGGMRGGMHRLLIGPSVGEYIQFRTRKPTGFPTTNFAFAMELAADGEFPARIWTNPTIAGAWLSEAALGSLAFREGETEVKSVDAIVNKPNRLWPFASARYHTTKIPNVFFDMETFCPVARASEPYWPALPIGFAQITIRNQSERERNVELVWRFVVGGDSRNVVADEVNGISYCGFDNDRFSVRSDAAPSRFEGDIVKLWSCRAIVPAGQERIVKFCFAQSPRASFAAQDTGNWPDSRTLALEGLSQFKNAYNNTLLIDSWMPRTGDAVIDEALRWYCASAVQLTKVSTNGTVAVMGYAEMTQRDGYWGSFLHNILFPDLEKRMIEEIFTEQNPNGKIPTSILPKHDREDDIDTNAYAMLRAFRYAKFHFDQAFLSQIAANLKGAAVWLSSRDRDGDGIPDAASNWYDWKDAPAMRDRKYSPHACFLYLAAFSEIMAAMKSGNDNVTIQKEVAERFALAKQTIHSPLEKGGLWNGRYYVERWKTESETRPSFFSKNIVNEDQIVGILFSVVPEDRISPIFDALLPNRRPWGFRESYPYRSDNFNYRQGDYLNGGVWPWLNYADAWARFNSGRSAEALTILRDVAQYDLFKSGEAMPHECLDGETGAPLRNAPQLWNSSFFGAVYHGLFGINREYNGLLTIEPRALPGRGWRVRVPLREGEVELADGEANQPPTLKWMIKEELPIRVKLPGREKFETILRPGNGEKKL